MKIAVSLFISSMIFGIAIAVIYGLTTHDVIGVLFLGIMALALTVVAMYIVVAEREAHLEGDRQDLAATDMAGEDLGMFTLESYWPILAATGTTVFLFGVVFAPGFSVALAILGAALIAWTLRFLVREST